MKNICALIILLLVLHFPALYAQSEAEMEEYYSEGQYFFNREEYEDALFYYLKLVKADPQNANYNFKVGEAYLQIPGKEHHAVPFFEKAVKDVVSKNSYKKRSFDEKSAPLHAWFYLGNAYRMNNQLNEALEAYMKFKDSPWFHNNYNLNVVDREIKSCERAAIIQDTPVHYESYNLGPNINSEFSEERPVISGDGNTIVFIRRLYFYDAIFCSWKKEGEWQEAININPQVLSDGEFYPTGLSGDGREMILVKRAGPDSHDLYSSVFDGETWSKAEKLQGRINSVHSEIHASYGDDGNTVIFTSNRKGSKGGFDIWKAQRDDKGKWSKVKNLGKQINTEVDEKSAFQSSDHNVLFFSSQGHYTMGGHDIFYSRMDHKKWKIPVNLGYPLNNTRDNLNYCPAGENCKKGYYSLSGEDSFGGTDLYLIEIKSENILYFSDAEKDK